MLKQTYFAVCLIFLAAINVQAQTQYSYYFDKDLNLEAKPSKAIFVGVGAYQNGLFELKVYDKRNKKLLVIEHFKDSSLAQSNGLFVSYLTNGNKQLEGVYSFGKKDGLWKEWNPGGQLLDSSFFKNGKKVKETTYTYYTDGKLLMEEDFKNDSIVKYASYDEKGKIISNELKPDTDIVFEKVEVEAAFPGGLAAWAQYISKAIMSHIDQFTKSDYGTCVVRFIVSKDGKVRDVGILNHCGKHLAKVGINAIKNGPKWIPAQQNGRYVNAYRLQPITLQNPDE